jgi:uncharacterized protein (DUF779 family)
MTTPTQTQWPTPTGERAQQHPDKRHEALDLAEWLVSEDMPTGSKSCAGAADMLAKQHALIVQMREAMLGPIYGAPVFGAEIQAALTAANDYLEQS